MLENPCFQGLFDVFFEGKKERKVLPDGKIDRKAAAFC